METLKSDLIKRVKMLEFALRQERLSKSSDQLAPNNNDLYVQSGGGLLQPNSVQQSASSHAGQSGGGGGGTLRKLSIVDSSEVFYAAPGSSNTINFPKSFGQSRSRDILKSYLKEADNLLAATKFSSAAARPKNNHNHQHQEADHHVPASSVMDPLQATLSSEEQSRKELAKKRSINFDSKPPLGTFGDSHLIDKGNLPGNFELPNNKSGTLKADKRKTKTISLAKRSPTSTLTSVPDRNSTKSPGEVGSSSTTENESYSVYTSWTPQPPLRSHYDSIRSIAFHPADTAIVSGSEDRTVKLWRASTIPNPSKENESRLVYTFKGHTGPVTSVAVSAIEDICFSGSLDASIRVWAIPSLNKPPFSVHDTSSKVHTLIGHSDAVWQIQPHMTAPLLLSCSADGSLKLWDVTLSNMHLKSTFWYNGPKTQASLTVFESPTSACWGNGNFLVAAYRNSVVKVFDAETRAITLMMASNLTFDDTTRTQINKVIDHPTLSITITAHQDGDVRMFDIHTGKCLYSFQAHETGVSSISISPDGFTLVSGGHDGTVKFWDLSTRKCLQTLPSLYSSSVWSVAHHKLYKNMVASGGSDGLLYILYSMAH